MERNGKMAIFLLFHILVRCSAVSSSAKVVNVTTFHWGGVSAYIAVNRQNVQSKLDEYHRLKPEAPKLSIPDDPVFPDLLDNQHIVYIDFGYVTGPLDFAEQPKIEHITKVMSVAIPYLQLEDQAASEGRRANYALALDKLYEDSNNKDIFKAQLIPMYIPVDEFKFGSGEVSLANEGQSVIHVTFNQTHPCQRASADIVEEFNHFLTGEDIFDASPYPDLNFCTRHPEVAESEYCETMDDIGEDVSEDLPNVCVQYSSASDDSSESSTPCQVSMEVVSITSGMRTALLLGKSDPITVLAAEVYAKHFTSSFKYPCVDN